LGGTSNHFKTRELIEIVGWDKYNVTEDTDLTYRLYRKGYKIKMLDSYTHEETVIDIKSWYSVLKNQDKILRILLPIIKQHFSMPLNKHLWAFYRQC